MVCRVPAHGSRAHARRPCFLHLGTRVGAGPCRAAGTLCSFFFGKTTKRHLDGHQGIKIIYTFGNIFADLWQCDDRPASPSAYRSPLGNTPAGPAPLTRTRVHRPRPGSAYKRQGFDEVFDCHYHGFFFAAWQSTSVLMVSDMNQVRERS